MKENIEIALNVLSEEHKSIQQEQAFTKIALEKMVHYIKEFEDKIKKFDIKAPEQDLSKFEYLIKIGMNKLAEIVQKQEKNVIHEKRILLYPEGERENFLKFIMRRLLLFAGIALCLYIFIPYLKSYLIERSKYKVAFDYVYYMDRENEEYYNSVLYTFENDSTRKGFVKYVKHLRNQE